MAPCRCRCHGRIYEFSPRGFRETRRHFLSIGRGPVESGNGTGDSIGVTRTTEAHWRGETGLGFYAVNACSDPNQSQEYPFGVLWEEVEQRIEQVMLGGGG